MQNSKISEILLFRKLANFQISKIYKTIKISKTLNLVNYHICILSVFRILKNVKINSKMEESNNSTFVIRISYIESSTFRRSKYWPPPFCYFNIRNFGISEPRLFYIWSFDHFYLTQKIPISNIFNLEYKKKLILPFGKSISHNLKNY